MTEGVQRRHEAREGLVKYLRALNSHLSWRTKSAQRHRHGETVIAVRTGYPTANRTAANRESVRRLRDFRAKRPQLGHDCGDAVRLL